MGVLEIILGNTGKKLQLKRMDAMLREIAALSPDEREYVKATFGKYLADGVTKEEAERAIRELKLNLQDSLDPDEVERVRMKILSFFV